MKITKNYKSRNFNLCVSSNHESLMSFLGHVINKYKKDNNETECGKEYTKQGKN